MDGADSLPGDFNSAFSSGSSGLGSLMTDSSAGKSLLSEYNNTNSILSRLNSGGSSASNHSSGLSGLGSNSFLSNNLNSLLESNNFDNNFEKFDDKFDSNFDILLSRNNRDEGGRNIGRSLWGCGDSHDSGIGHSPPYDSPDWSSPNGVIWNELGKVLGNMDSPTERHSPVVIPTAITKPSNDQRQHALNNPRSASIDLGIPMGNNNILNNPGINSELPDTSQANSLPFTIESLSASLNTLTVSQGESRQQESLLASLARTTSPQAEAPTAFPSVDTKPIP